MSDFFDLGATRRAYAEEQSNIAAIRRHGLAHFIGEVAGMFTARERWSQGAMGRAADARAVTHENLRASGAFSVSITGALFVQALRTPNAAKGVKYMKQAQRVLCKILNLDDTSPFHSLNRWNDSQTTTFESVRTALSSATSYALNNEVH